MPGNFTCKEVRFVLRRNIGFYLIQMYVPSGLIVILSWVSFFIDSDAVPARISLGVLTILTMITQSSSTLHASPKVSYVTALNVWTTMCLIFVFLALIEFAVLNVLARVSRKPSAASVETTDNNGDVTVPVDRSQLYSDPGSIHLRHRNSDSKQVGINILTHWGRDRMPAIFQTTFWNGFSWNLYKFRLKCHWSLFLGAEITIFNHLFR